MAKRLFRESKKKDTKRRAKPAGYRYKVGDDKSNPLYYKRPTAEEIEKFKAGDKRMQRKIYYDARVDHADTNQAKKLENGGELDEYKKGGAIKNQYKNRDVNDIWESWNQEQREHFLHDHKDEIEKKHLEDVKENINLSDYLNTAVRYLPHSIHSTLVDHIMTGEYKKGGRIKRTRLAIEKDKTVKAMHEGKRESEDGSTYYEYRSNRSDKDRRKKFKNGGEVAEKIDSDDLVVGKRYKYLHEKNTEVVYLKESGDTHLFSDKKGEWIGISDDELSDSISELPKIDFNKFKDETVLKTLIDSNEFVTTDILSDITGKKYEWNERETKVGSIKLKRAFLTNKWYKVN